MSSLPQGCCFQRVWRPRKADVKEDIFSKRLSGPNVHTLKKWAHFSWIHCNKKIKKPSPNWKLFLSVQIMHDECPNDVSYVYPKSPNSGGFVRPLLSVSPAACSRQVSQCSEPLHTLRLSVPGKLQQSEVFQPGKSSCPVSIEMDWWLHFSKPFYTAF